MEKDFRLPDGCLDIDEAINAVNDYFYSQAQAVLRVVRLYRERAETCGCRRCWTDYDRYVDEKNLEWSFDRWEGVVPEPKKIPVKWDPSQSYKE